MKRKLLIIIPFCFCLFGSYAENGRQERFEEILQNRIEYISTKIELTKDEKEKFVPVYKEFQEKRMSSFQKNDKGFRQKEIKQYTEDDYQTINEAYINNKLNRATLDRVYYEKFKEFLPESKIHKMFQAEKEYKNELLKQLEKKGKQRHQ